MKVKLKQLVNATGALNVLERHALNDNFTAKDAFAVGTLITEAQQHLGVYQRVRNKALEKYGTKKDENGNYDFENSDKEEAFFAADSSALDSDVNIRIPKFEVEKLEKWGLSASQFASLAFCMKNPYTLEVE